MKIPSRIALQNKTTRHYLSDRKSGLSKTFNPSTSLLVVEELDNGNYHIYFERTGVDVTQYFASNIFSGHKASSPRREWSIEIADDLLRFARIKDVLTGEYLRCQTDDSPSPNRPDAAVHWSILNKEEVAQVDMRIVINGTPMNSDELETLRKASAPNGDKKYFDRINEDNRVMGNLVEYASKQGENSWINLEGVDGTKSKAFFYGNAHIIVTPQEKLSSGCKKLCSENDVDLDDYKTKVEYVVQYAVGRNTTVQTVLCTSAMMVTSGVITSMLIKGMVAMFEQVVGRAILGLTEVGALTIEQSMSVEMAYMRCMSWMYSSSGWAASLFRCVLRFSVYAVVAYIVLYFTLPFLIRAYTYQILISNFSDKQIRIRVPHLDNVDNASKYKQEDQLLSPVSDVEHWITINDIPFKVTDKVVYQSLMYFANDNTFLEGMGDLITFNTVYSETEESNNRVCLTTLIPRFPDNSINITESKGSTDFKKIYNDSKGKNKVLSLEKTVDDYRVEMTMSALSGADNNEYNSICNVFDK